MAQRRTHGLQRLLGHRRRAAADHGAAPAARTGIEREAGYESVLVALEAEHFSPDVVLTAQKLAARRRRGIHVLVWVNVPNSAPVDARLPEKEAAAQAAIEQAKLLGGRRVTGHVEKIRAGQAGRLVIQQARELRAAAIVMPLPRRVHGGSLFGSTLETVLAERPCRVIIESVPDGAGEGPSAVSARPSSGAGDRWPATR